MQIVHLVLAFVSLGADPKPADRPIPAKDAAKAMTVPDGFKVTLFAGEPDVVQPIAFTFDDRGRMWVVECLSYPNWRHDGKGNDRVIILEDTDNDGHFDKKTVFLDDGANLSGIELGFGGVWLCSSPNLVFVPILDGDRPGKPEIRLDGWNIKDTKHNIFNSLGWGPDGWLYGCNGIQAKAWVGAPGTPQDKRTYIDCGVWRYHPTRKVFEAVAHGTTNPFGLDWDEYGEMFITNCVIDHLFHIVPGGHYERMYGQDANPHVYGLMKSCVDYKHWAGGDWTSSRSTGVGGSPTHSDFGGGHAHSGCAIYLGDNFPAEYRNTLFTANIHGNRLNNDGLQRTPTGYKGVRRKDFLFANDSWFRGICVKCGPDGALYVSDWCDTGECHNYDKADTTNGRIYRVSFGDPKQWTGDVSKLSNKELLKMSLTHANDWFVRKARRVLQERAVAGKFDWKSPEIPEEDLKAALPILAGKKNVDPRLSLRLMWVLRTVYGSVAADDPEYKQYTGKNWFDLTGTFLAVSDERVQLQAVRWAMERFHGSEKDMAQILLALPEDASPAVWAAAAPVLRWLPRGTVNLIVFEGGTFALFPTPGLREFKTADLATKLLARSHMMTDAEVSKLVWYSGAEWLAKDPETAVPALLTAPSRLIRQNTYRAMLSEPQPKFESNLARLMSELSKTQSAEVQADILRAMREGMAGRRDVKDPGKWPLWATVYKNIRAKKVVAVLREAEAVGAAIGDPVAIAELMKRLLPRSAPAATRQFALEALMSARLPEFGKTLRGLLGDPAMRQAAVRGLAAYPDAETPDAILKAYSRFKREEKADAVQTLAARVPWANALLDAIEKKQIPPSDVPIAAARQILALNDEATTARLDKVWGKITPASKERAALMKKWKEVLSEGTLAKGDGARGRAVFTKHCASCHKMFGEGESVGPELTGSQRANLDYVLENVLDPSAVVPNEFRVTHFTTADERVVSGIVLRETKDAVTVRTANDTVVLPIADIASRKPTNVSIMPDGLFDLMKPDEVRDLVAYLRSKEQVPLPK